MVDYYSTYVSFLMGIFLIIYAGDSFAAPQMCNEFIGSTVTINVCKTKCYRHYHGRGMCLKTAPPAPPPANSLSTKVQKQGKPGCNCVCIFVKKPNKPCNGPKPNTTF